MARVLAVSGRRVTPLSDGWTLAVCESGAGPGPEARWLPAPVPGTVAEALRRAGRWSLDDPAPLHGLDIWYRRRLTGEEGDRVLRLRGLATLAEVWLDGVLRLTSDSMFIAHDLAVRLAGDHELRLCFRALAPLLGDRPGRGRWRPRLVDGPGLRRVRTTLLGHMPGWCPPVHAVGPWRGVELMDDTGPLIVQAADVRTALRDGTGGVAVRLEVDWRGPPGVAAFIAVGDAQAPLAWRDTGTLDGELRLPGVAPWWPHTHGEPALHRLRARIGAERVELGRVGFRSLTVDTGDDGQGFALRVNGEPVFCRGACWTSADPVALPGTRQAYAPWLALMREAGMNMVRVGGTMVYEDDAFFDLCDELGLLVWQDFMFANFDYPTGAGFLDSVRREAGQFLDRVQASPSLAVLCGGSEAAQQAAMLGLPPETWRQPLFDEVLPEVAARLRPDVPYVANTPHGGALPFVADSGVTHYYGVGAYRRPLDDARRAGVRFAAECLAFSNVPEAATLARIPAQAGRTPAHPPRWKERVPRDPGASWDFEDVRDHYLERLYGVDASALRASDPDRALRLARAVTGEVMEAVFAEWRRARSPCAGGLVWQLQDLWPGAGWGVVDALGVPKAAWHALKRAFRPVQVLLSDEGVNGLAIHLINETARPVSGVLALLATGRGGLPAGRWERAVELAARSNRELPATAWTGRFVDLSAAYGFGPPQFDGVAAVLMAGEGDAEGGAVLAEAVHFPGGRGLERQDLGLEAAVRRDGDGWALALRCHRLACSVHIEDDGWRAADEWFHLLPGRERLVRLLARGDGGAPPDGEVYAINAWAPLRYRGVA